MTHIKILGTGCRKCQQLVENAKAAAEQLGAQCEIEKVTELEQIMRHGVMMTPGLVINGQVMSSGKVPSVEAIRSMLQSGGPA